MDRSLDTIHIVTAADAAYVPHIGAMLHSLFSCNGEERFEVHFFHRQVMERSSFAGLERLCVAHSAIFSDVSVDPSWLDGMPVGGWYIEEAWYRLFLAQLIPEVDKVLWLDADTIVMAPVGELWRIDLRGQPLAACPNALLYSAKDSVRNMGITERQRYFNTGVLLMDLALMRREKSNEALKAAAIRYQQWIHFADQDVLNCVYHQRYVRLPLKWNFLTHSYINVPETLRVHGEDEYREARRSPNIVHFTGRSAKKPWSYQCSHPYREKYLEHRLAAGFGRPNYANKTLRNRLLRLLPLRFREAIGALGRRQFLIAKSYFVQW